MIRSTTFDVDGSIVEDVHAPAAQEALWRAKAARVRPLCLCQSAGVEMYIAAAGEDLVVKKRMPGSAAAHDHQCRSWLPPHELSGYGAVAEHSIVDNPVDGTTALRLGFFSLSKLANRAAPPNQAAPRRTRFSRRATNCHCVLCCTTCGMRRN